MGEDGEDVDDVDGAEVEDEEELTGGLEACLNSKIEPMEEYCEEIGECSVECLGIAYAEVQPTLESCCDALGGAFPFEAIVQCKSNVQSGSVLADALGCTTHT